MARETFHIADILTVTTDLTLTAGIFPEHPMDRLKNILTFMTGDPELSFSEAALAGEMAKAAIYKQYPVLADADPSALNDFADRFMAGWGDLVARDASDDELEAYGAEHADQNEALRKSFFASVIESLGGVDELTLESFDDEWVTATTARRMQRALAEQRFEAGLRRLAQAVDNAAADEPESDDDEVCPDCGHRHASMLAAGAILVDDDGVPHVINGAAMVALQEKAMEIAADETKTDDEKRAEIKAIYELALIDDEATLATSPVEIALLDTMRDDIAPMIERYTKDA